MKKTVFNNGGRRKGQKCAPVAPKNTEAYRTLAQKVDITNPAEVRAAQYLLQLANWFESPEYLEAKAIRMHFKKLRLAREQNENQKGVRT